MYGQCHSQTDTEAYETFDGKEQHLKMSTQNEDKFLNPNLLKPYSSNFPWASLLRMLTILLNTVKNWPHIMSDVGMKYALGKLGLGIIFLITQSLLK